MVSITRLKPVNRHLLIIPHIKKNETQSGVVLPEDYQPERDEFVEATVIDVADDCGKQFSPLRYGTIDSEKKVIVQRSMILEVKTSDRSHHLILENYVLGIIRRVNED